MSSFLVPPLGFRFDGRPIWGFSGAEGENDGGDGGSGDGDGGGTGDGGDGGGTERDPVKVLENTLAKVRDERKAVQDEFRPYKATLRELGIQNPEQLKELLTKGSGAGSGNGQQQQVDVEKIRETERTAVRLEANREIALANVEAKAKGMFEDPNDAVDHLRKSVDDLLGRDGKPDPKAIERELGDLLAAKPHWAAKKDKDISFDGGVRQPGGGQQDMNSFIRQTSRNKRGQ